MKIYESGRESSLLDDIKNGHKTVECRLNRGKFADYQPGDFAWLRRDTYENGKIINEHPHDQLVKITKIEHHPTFRALIEAAGVSATVPRATSIDEAVAECHKYYSVAEESQFGVIGIHFQLADPAELPA